jgi:hypothetical protein
MNLRHIGVLVLVVAAVAIVSGCTSTPAVTGVTRSISPAAVSPGGTITVTLDVGVDNERFYIIEEIPPAGWVVTDKGQFHVDPENHIKYVQLQNAADASYTIQLRAPDTPGEYEFAGIYQMDGMDNHAAISGTSKVTVS